MQIGTDKLCSFNPQTAMRRPIAPPKEDQFCSFDSASEIFL